MKQNPPKFPLVSVILTVTIIASIIIYAAYKSTRVQTKPLRDTTDTVMATDTIQSSYNIPKPTDQTVKHEAYTFHNADIYTVMKKIQEWYPVIYAFRKPLNNRFTGTIPKDLSLNEVLNGLVTMTSDTIVFQRIGDQQIVINPVGNSLPYK